MAKHRTYSIEFKRQVAQEFLAGESLHGLSRRHDVSRNLIRVWVAKLEAGTYDEDAEAADLLQEYEAKIAALERLVGRQALEIEFLKGALNVNGGAKLVHPGGAKLVHLTLCGTRCWGVVPVVHRRDPRCFV